MNVVVAVCAFTVLASVAVAGHPMKSESGWFDFENCVFCKNLVEDPELMMHTTWENHVIKNGMLNIMTVDPAYAESLATAEKKMNELGMKIQAGEVNPMGLEMCKSCQTSGMLMMSGVNMERVKGDAAMVTLMTSNDPALITQLQDMAKRHTEEMALMMGGAEHPHAEHPKKSEHPKGEHPK
jgi:hypothetical protein